MEISLNEIRFRVPLGYLIYISIGLLMILGSFSCEKDEIVIITPEEGFAWPGRDRSYWPTDSWIIAPMESHSIDPAKIELAQQFAKDDPLTRALLVIKGGYLVVEQYYGDGGVDQSTHLWSVTKSFTSALVGFLYDDGYIISTQQGMAELMPAYPEFGEITLHHVLTMSSGLSWAETGPLWVDWIFSDDWVSEALARGQIDKPGSKFYYSSGNSHFLTSLVYHQTGITPGQLAKQRIFDPLGIPFDTISGSVTYSHWEDYKEPVPQSWRKDPKGIECAGFGLFLTARDMAKFGYLYLNKGHWDGHSLISEDWIEISTRDQMTNIYGRYSYGYHWWITKVGGFPVFLASGYGGQIIGIVPSLDMVVVIKYEADDPKHPVPGSRHDDMHLFELVVNAVM